MKEETQMKVEVLVSTMFQKNNEILNNMNINTDAIIVNQCNENKIEEFSFKNRRIRLISLNERGVGLSRNTALMRANEEICLFADDDVVYVDEYESLILDAFNKNPKAGVIMFNVPSTNTKRPSPKITKVKKLSIFNSMKYGTFCMAIRKQKIYEANVTFSLLFGGGAKYSAGEDSLFIAECIRKKIGVYTSPHTIGTVSHEESTWFKGYNEKYFIDKGAFFSSLSKKLRKLLCLQFLIRHKEVISKEIGMTKAYKLMKLGFEDIK